MLYLGMKLVFKKRHLPHNSFHLFLPKWHDIKPGVLPIYTCVLLAITPFVQVQSDIAYK